MGVFEILAIATNPQVSSVDTQIVNSFYLSWSCFGVLATLFFGSIAFLTNLIPLVKNSQEKFETARLTLKENTATIFMDTIATEAELLIGVIIEHLPISITQTYKSTPHISLFDNFCFRLMELGKEPAEDPRKVISNTMAEEFSNHLAEEARKLLKILQMHSRLGGTDYNATGISYALKGDTAIKFSFIAQHLSKAEEKEKAYLFCQKAYRAFFIISIISFGFFLVPLFLNKSYCNQLGTFLISTLVISFLTGFLLWWRSFAIIEKIDHLIKEDFQSAYDKWKKE